MQTSGNILVSVTVGGKTSSTWVISGCDVRRTDDWDVSQNFLRWSKDRQLGIEPNSFSVGRRTDVWDLSRLGLESIVSASVDGQTSGAQVNSFGHILCKEDPCLTVVGTWELTYGTKLHHKASNHKHWKDKLYWCKNICIQTSSTQVTYDVSYSHTYDYSC